MNQNFAAIILGGTGQVGGAAVAELLAIPECREVVMVTRKPIAARSRVRNVAQFCLLSAVGSTARSRFRYVRVMGMKEDTVRNIGFTRLAIFRPGVIVGNAHTPAWVGLLGSLVPGPFGNIDQRILGRSIAAEIALHSREAGEVSRENAAMKKLAAQFNSVTLAFLREV
jgi:uncharacterized protein YbjT (DUF2867 family)